MEDREEDEAVQVGPVLLPETQDCIWKSQVDASWSEADIWMGMGFVLLEADREILAGKKCKRKGTSALQAEAEALG